MVQVLKQCGNDLTRENVMKQAANLKNFKPACCCRASRCNTRPTDYAPIEQAQLAKFNGKQWVLFGDVLGGTA